MRCPNPGCKNNALKEEHAFCFECGTQLKAPEKASSPSVETPATNAKDLTCIAQNSDVANETDVSPGKMLWKCRQY